MLHLVDLGRIADCLEQGALTPIHVDSHPEDRKTFEEFSDDDWGNYIAAKVYEMQQCSASSLSTRIRIVMNKGWHGGNRIKSKKATEEAGFCYLCG